MKRYQLIKEYPHSVPLNTEAKRCISPYSAVLEYYSVEYYNDGCFHEGTLSKEEVENFPEFWQLVSDEDERSPSQLEVWQVIQDSITAQGINRFPLTQWSNEALTELYDKLYDLFYIAFEKEHKKVHS